MIETRTLNVVGCMPTDKRSEEEEERPWVLCYLEVQDANGNPLEGRFKSWQELEPGLAEYDVKTEDSERYGISYVLRPAGSSGSARRAQPARRSPVEALAERVKELAVLLASLMERVTRLEASLPGHKDTEDIPF